MLRNETNTKRDVNELSSGVCQLCWRHKHKLNTISSDYVDFDRTKRQNVVRYSSADGNVCVPHLLETANTSIPLHTRTHTCTAIFLFLITVSKRHVKYFTVFQCVKYFQRIVHRSIFLLINCSGNEVNKRWIYLFFQFYVEFSTLFHRKYLYYPRKYLNSI